MDADSYGEVKRQGVKIGKSFCYPSKKRERENGHCQTKERCGLEDGSPLRGRFQLRQQDRLAATSGDASRARIGIDAFSVFRRAHRVRHDVRRRDHCARDDAVRRPDGHLARHDLHPGRGHGLQHLVEHRG